MLQVILAQTLLDNSSHCFLPFQFAWCDGPLLGALKSGHWVLLDELNLASQVRASKIFRLDNGESQVCLGSSLTQTPKTMAPKSLMPNPSSLFQAVLEGLNALLDHRAEVFIPELGASYRCHPGFRLFGAQNPLQEGGGRKGLPKSFLNRFTRVHVELLTREDMLFITGVKEEIVWKKHIGPLPAATDVT